MKIVIVFFFVFGITFSQNKSVQIHKVKYEYKIKNVVDLVSFVPQIKMSNKLVQNKINRDIKKHFNATSLGDKAIYTKNILKENNVKTVQEYKKLKDDELQSALYQDSSYYEDREEESYYIEFLSTNILNISVSVSFDTYHGRGGLSFASFCYDLKTGERLRFKDIFSIDENALVKMMVDYGYYWEPRDVGEPNHYEKIRSTEEYILPGLKDFLQKEDDNCIEFYFNKINGKTHLLFTYTCSAPGLLEYGVSMEYLKPYIRFKYF